MKIRRNTILLMTICILTFLTACGLQDINDVPESVVDAVEDKHDEVKENIKDTVTATDSTRHTTQATADANGKISEGDAEAIALKHAGFTAEQVSRMRTEYEVDDGVPEYEVQYYYDNMEYEYTIHAETGEILSYDWDN